jgi:hypothetical protein
MKSLWEDLFWLEYHLKLPLQKVDNQISVLPGK